MSILGKKHLGKIISVILVFTFSYCFCIPAFASDNEVDTATGVQNEAISNIQYNVEEVDGTQIETGSYTFGEINYYYENTSDEKESTTKTYIVEIDGSKTLIEEININSNTNIVKINGEEVYVLEDTEHIMTLDSSQNVIHELPIGRYLASGSGVIVTAASVATSLVGLIKNVSLGGQSALTIGALLSAASIILSNFNFASYTMWMNEYYLFELFPADYPGYSVREFIRQTLYYDDLLSNVAAGPRDIENLYI